MLLARPSCTQTSKPLADLVFCTPNSLKSKLNCRSCKSSHLPVGTNGKEQTLVYREPRSVWMCLFLGFSFLLLLLLLTCLPQANNDGEFNFPMCTLVWNTLNPITLTFLLFFLSKQEMIDMYRANWGVGWGDDSLCSFPWLLGSHLSRALWKVR